MDEDKSILDEMVDAQLQATGDMGDGAVAFVEEAGDFGGESAGTVIEANGVYAEAMSEFPHDNEDSDKD